MSESPMPRDVFDHHLRPVGLGLALALLASLFGIALGVAFGAAEESLKAGLEASGKAALAEVYQGDDGAMKAVLAKSWAYYKRAHLHAGAMGAGALAAIFVLALAGGPRRLLQGAAFGLGAGALGYALFWLLAGVTAPGLGSTDAAKAALEWLALPSAGAYGLGMLLAFVLLVRRLLRGGATA